MTMTEAKFSYTRKVQGELYTVRGDTFEEFFQNGETAFGLDVWAEVIQAARGQFEATLGAEQVQEVLQAAQAPAVYAPVAQVVPQSPQVLQPAPGATWSPQPQPQAEPVKDYTIKDPGAPASDAQKNLINKMSKGSYPSAGLTKGQAKEVIDQLMAQQKRG